MAQSIEYARLHEQITPETLPEVINNKLDGMMLTNIIRAIDKQFVPKSKSNEANLVHVQCISFLVCYAHYCRAIQTEC